MTRHFHPDPLKRQIPQALVDTEIFDIQLEILNGIRNAAQDLHDKKHSYLQGETLKREMRDKVEANLNALDNTWAAMKVLFEKAAEENQQPFDASLFNNVLHLYHNWRSETHHFYKKVYETPIPVSGFSRKVLKGVIKDVGELISFVNSAKEKYLAAKKSKGDAKDADSV